MVVWVRSAKSCRSGSPGKRTGSDAWRQLELRDDKWECKCTTRGGESYSTPNGVHGNGRRGPLGVSRHATRTTRAPRDARLGWIKRSRGHNLGLGGSIFLWIFSGWCPLLKAGEPKFTLETGCEPPFLPKRKGKRRFYIVLILNMGSPCGTGQLFNHSRCKAMLDQNPTNLHGMSEYLGNGTVLTIWVCDALIMKAPND